MDEEIEKTTQELLTIIRENLHKPKLKKLLQHYHESDIADAVQLLSKDERLALLETLGNEYAADIIPYLDNVEDYIEELDKELAADVLEEMDADDAIDVLEELDEDDRKEIVNAMEDEAMEDVKLIASHDEDEIGSLMTTNYISIPEGSTIKQAMRRVVKEAGENDNINVIYVVDENEKFIGSIELKDLIIARTNTLLESITHTNYPALHAHDKISEEINNLKEYALDMVPVLDDSDVLIGVITSSDVIEAVDDEMGEDYAKLAGLSDEEDINEPYLKSLKKRLPWLILLLVMGLCVSLVISTFEAVIAMIPMVVFFQSIVLDMSGNVGTQSLAVTIRFLNDDELTGKKVGKMIWKEVKIGLTNGVILGSLSFLVVLLFLFIKNEPITPDAGTFLIHDAIYLASSVLIAIVASLTLASFVGVAIPCILKKCKVDPAVASGPLITTIDDLVAVVAYFGISMAFFLTM